MAYEMVMPYHLHMPSYFLETFTEYPELTAQYYLADLRRISDLRGIYCFQPVADDYYRRHSFRFPDFEVVYAGSLSFWAGNTQLSR